MPKLLICEILADLFKLNDGEDDNENNGTSSHALSVIARDQ